MLPSNHNKQQLLALFESGQAENRLLAEQLAIATEIDLLALLEPYQALLSASPPSLELYAQLFSQQVYNAANQKLEQLHSLEELIIHNMPLDAYEQNRLADLLPHAKGKVNFDYLY